MGNLVLFDPVKAQLQEFVSKNMVKVEDQRSMQTALTVCKDAKILAKRVEEIRTALVKPHNDQVKAINTYAKSLLKPLDDFETLIKDQLKLFEAKLEKIRQAEAEKAEKERQQAETKARKEAEIASLFDEKEGAQAEIMLEAKVVEAEATKKAQLAQIAQNKVTGARRVWTFEVTDEAKVPREFLSVDEKKIRQAVREGAREIPGVRIFQETSIAII